MKDKFKVVFVGAGGRANSVTYPSFADLENVELAGICDINHQRLNETADKYNIAKRYSHSVFAYQDMINDIKPDAVVAVGQPDEMYNIWMWTLENKYNLFVEKPLALTIHQARSLELTARKNSCITAVSFQRRTTPMVMQMRDECLKRGPITHAFCRFYKNQIETLTGSRDHMMDDCVHSIDTLRWICGGEVVKVESHCRRVLVDNINFISATLYFDNGAVGYLINSWSSGRRIFSVEIHAPGICAEAEHETTGRLYLNNDTTGLPYSAVESAGSDKFHVYTGVRNLAEEFVNGCINKVQPQTNFSDAVKTMEVAEIILAQALLAGK